MREGFEMVRDTLLKAESRPVYFLLACAAIIFLLVRRKKEEEKLLGVYSVVMLLTFLCPLSAMIIAPLLRKGEVYWRYLWLFPTAVLIGCAGVALITERRKRILNVLTGLILVAVLLLGGRNLYAAGYFSKATSKEKVETMTMQVSSAIEEIRSTTKRKYAKLAAPQNVSAQIREINSHVIVHARRNLNLDWVRINRPKKYKTLAVLFGVAVDDEHRAVRRLKYARCNYILMYDRVGCNDDLAAKGYHIIASGDDWNLWFNPRVKKRKNKAKANKKKNKKKNKENKNKKNKNKNKSTDSSSTSSNVSSTADSDGTSSNSSDVSSAGSDSTSSDAISKTSTVSDTSSSTNIDTANNIGANANANTGTAGNTSVSNNNIDNSNNPDTSNTNSITKKTAGESE